MTLADARGQLEWTQTELARRAGEKHSNIRDIENGANRNPSHALVTRVVDALVVGGLDIQPADIDEFRVVPREGAQA